MKFKLPEGSRQYEKKKNKSADLRGKGVFLD